MLEIVGSKMKTITPSFRVLGVRIDAVKTFEAVAKMERLIETSKTGSYVAVTGMHGIAEAQQDPGVRQILNQADLVVPDGMPLVWLARWHRHPLRRRVPGSELMEAFCKKTGPRYRHFFYGGTPEVAKEVASLVDKSRPDVLWVGLSTPKQERWIYEHRNRLKVAIMLGVGAAFDMNSGRLRRAPRWMQDNGLEWLFRLLAEPRRLWKRYLVTIPSSMWAVSLELFHIRKFE